MTSLHVGAGLQPGKRNNSQKQGRRKANALKMSEFQASKLWLAPSRYTGTVTQSTNDSPETMPGEIRRTGILGIDYGRARIGLALADARTALPRPLDTLQRINRNEDMRRLREIVRTHAVKQIVVGLPLRLDGSRGEMAEEAARFGERIRKQLGIPVEMVDERLTSWEAERLLEDHSGKVFHDDAKTSHKKRRESTRASVDAMAAAVILKEYLEREQIAGKSI
jgi:putative Holliday junction resolvase